MLQTQYGFRCSCQACTSPDERQFFVQFSAPLCRANVNGCKGPVEVKFSGPNTRGGVCLLCGLAQDSDSSWEGLVGEALKVPTVNALRQAEKLMASKVHNNHQKLQQVRDELARCLVEEGDYCGAETMLRCTLATTCLRYGDTSVEYSNELLKFTDILEAKLNSDLKVDTRELVKLLVKAKNIFQMQYGDTFSQVQEIQGKLNFFQRLGIAKEA